MQTIQRRAFCTDHPDQAILRNQVRPVFFREHPLIRAEGIPEGKQRQLKQNDSMVSLLQSAQKFVELFIKRPAIRVPQQIIPANFDDDHRIDG